TDPISFDIPLDYRYRLTVEVHHVYNAYFVNYLLITVPEPVYVYEPEYPEYLAPFRDEAPIEYQPIPTDASPTALSLGYVDDSDPEEDHEEDHADYPADREDGDDEPSDDDDDDDDTDDEDEKASEDNEDDEEEEEHLAPPDSSAIPVVDPVLSARDTEAFETDEAQKTVIPQTPILFPPEAEIPSPPLPVSSLLLPLPSPLTTSPIDTGASLGYRAAGIRVRALLPSTSHRTDILEAEMPPRKRDCFTTPALGFEIVKAMLEIAPTILEGVNQRVTELATTIRQDTDEFYVQFEDAQDDRAFLRARVNTLFRDRQFYCHTAMLLDREATYARRAWTGSEDRSAAIEAHARDPKPQDEPAEAGISC
ncbi:hypothetical protein Tco_1349180, partial [Tanacetum coccineum]